jgi:hypothetical protein
VSDPERYAVVSCHVERPLDDRVWRLFSQLQERAPGRLRIAALMRPPAPEEERERETFLARAREAAARGPLGHHTHFTAPDHARPVEAEGAGERVLVEGTWLRDNGLEPTLFCGGGWYMDAEVAAAVASLGYTDCTATCFRPGYLAPGAPRISAAGPTWLELENGSRVLELPTTHSLGMLASAAVSPRGLREPVVHAYFHDTDLLDRRRSAALRIGLALLGVRRSASDLEHVAAAVSAEAAAVPFSEAAAVQ